MTATEPENTTVQTTNAIRKALETFVSIAQRPATDSSPRHMARAGSNAEAIRTAGEIEDVVLMYDLTGRIIDAREPAHPESAAIKRQLVGHKIDEFIGPDHRKTLDSMLLRDSWVSLPFQRSGFGGPNGDGHVFVSRLTEPLGRRSGTLIALFGLHTGPA